MTDETDMETWMAMVEKHRRINLDPRIDAMVMHVPLRMTIDDTPKPDPVKFLIDQRFGGMEVRPRDRMITVVQPPDWMQALLDDGWWKRHASTWRSTVVVDCETPMVVGLHPFVRVRRNDAHPDPAALGRWRVDDDHGSATESKRVRVDRYVGEGSTHSGVSHRAWLAPVGPVYREDEWHRSEGGRISDARVNSGRYANRLPTNRKAKRARCKARRRARLPRRHWVARARRGER